MPQGPIATADVLGGTNSALNITAAAVIKASPGRVVNVIVENAGTSGVLTINDCATVAAASAANQVASIPYNATNFYAGAVVSLGCVCKVGIVVSAVPGGVPVVAITYT